MVYESSAHPGCVAPHLWLADGSSLYDHFQNGFNLLVTEDGHDTAIAAFERAAAAIAMPLKVVQPHDTRLRSRYQAALALIRPDQHVAWRGDALPDSPAAVLGRIAGRAGCQAKSCVVAAL